MSLLSSQNLNHLSVNDFNVTNQLSVAGATTLSGSLTASGAVIGAVQALTGAGAVSLTTLTTTIEGTATGTAYSLAAGTAGQVKIVVYVAEDSPADTAILTPNSLVGGSTIGFNDVGDAAVLVYTGTAWAIAGAWRP